MRKFHTHLQSIILMVLFAFTTVQKVNASAKAGEASVFEGSTVTISLADTYRRTLMQATGVNYQWYSESNSYATVTSSTRYTATVKGVKATSSCKVYFKCSYFIDGFFRTMDFYYDITVKTTSVSVTSISLCQSSLSMKEGSTELLTAYVYPANATNRNVNWSSSNTYVATVNSYGLVSAKSAGTATITCRAADGSGKYAVCNVSVKDPVKPMSITLDKTRATLTEGETLQLVATVMPLNAEDRTITWGCDNTTVATVNADGLVTARSIGTANIIATTSNNLTTVCAITVENEDVGMPMIWSGHYRVSSSHVENNPTRTYQDNFEMTIEEKDGAYYVTSMFGDDLVQYNDGGFKLYDNGDGTAAIDVSYYNILKYTDNDSPLYIIYVFDEVADDWGDSWTLKMNEDGSINIGEFYVASFSWFDDDDKWKNGQLEALYFNLTAKKENVSGISDVNAEMPEIHIEHGTIRMDKTVYVTVYRENGVTVFSGKTNVVENLPKGLYIVKIGSQSQKILIK